MSESLNYRIDIVERTEHLLKGGYTFCNEYEVTFLINCLLGIIVAASEFDCRKGKRLGNKNFSDSLLAIIPSNLTFFDREKAIRNLTIEKNTVSWSTLNKDSLSTDLTKNKYNLGWFLSKLRNAIAHQHIEAINTENKWTGIKLWNEPYKDNIDFTVEFSTDNLKALALYIADTYLKIYGARTIVGPENNGRAN